MQILNIETLFESIRLSRLELASNDMSFQQRQQSHAHINWCIDELRLLANY